MISKILKLADGLDAAGFLKEADNLVEAVVQAKKKKKWIPKKMKKGRFTEWCKGNGFSGPSKACANKALKSDDASVRGMASFYLNVPAKKKKKGSLSIVADVREFDEVVKVGTYDIYQVAEMCPDCAKRMIDYNISELIIED